MNLWKYISSNSDLICVSFYLVSHFWHIKTLRASLWRKSISTTDILNNILSKSQVRSINSKHWRMGNAEGRPTPMDDEILREVITVEGGKKGGIFHHVGRNYGITHLFLWKLPLGTVPANASWPLRSSKLNMIYGWKNIRRVLWTRVTASRLWHKYFPSILKTIWRKLPITCFECLTTTTMAKSRSRSSCWSTTSSHLEILMRPWAKCSSSLISTTMELSGKVKNILWR